MFYNVENLFDTIDDPNTNDEYYHPVIKCGIPLDIIINFN